MSLLEALQLIGYSLGAVLPLWMGYLLFRGRLGATPIQRLLLGLGLCMVGWHAGNLVITVHGLLGLDVGHWTNLLRLASSIAVISITVCYSLLLHVHLELWATARARQLTRTERLRVYLSYLPCLVLFLVVPRIWAGHYQPMIVKLSAFVAPFAIWAAYALSVISITEFLVARRASPSEQRILRTLAFSFIGIAVLILAALGFGLGNGTVAGNYLQTFANLGSLLPSALLVYYIYRYRYLELIIKESVIVATFAAMVLVVYLSGIRRIGEWVHARYGLRAGVIEVILILALTFLAAPLRSWLEKSFRILFERETALYREVVAQIGAHAGEFGTLAEFLNFIETQTANALSLRRVKILIPSEHQETPRSETSNGRETTQLPTSPSGAPFPRVGDELRKHGYDLSYSLLRENRELGTMLIAASSNALTPDVRAVLEVLAGQVAIAIEDFRLIEENVRLARQVAEGERLAALGQMAATVAHEVKNPLSAIKSIAQVMCEDETLRDRHARDLSLIVSETDRLNKSVTQLLSFARKKPPSAAPSNADELLRSIANLFRADAAEHELALECRVSTNTGLDGVQSAAIRDGLSNLVLNAIQSTPPGGRVTIEAQTEGDTIIFAVSDSGPGIPSELAAKIWEPFFTTRQRGTGLGLAIVRKRMQDASGSAHLVAPGNGGGARFELRIPNRSS